MNLDEFSELGRCNGVFSLIFRPDNNENKSIETMRKVVNSNNKEFDIKINQDITGTIEHNNKENYYYCSTTSKVEYSKNIYKLSNEYLFYLCCLVTSNRENFYCVSTYSRRALYQTGTGHFTIISLFNPIKKLLLIMDVARFKANSLWISLERLYKSMKLVDNTTKLPRGYLLCGTYFYNNSAICRVSPISNFSIKYNFSNILKDENQIEKFLCDIITYYYDLQNRASVKILDTKEEGKENFISRMTGKTENINFDINKDLFNKLTNLSKLIVEEYKSQLLIYEKYTLICYYLESENFLELISLIYLTLYKYFKLNSSAIIAEINFLKTDSFISKEVKKIEFFLGL